MSYARGMGTTATDIAAVSAAAAQLLAAGIAAGTGTPGAASAATIDPATGLPYGTVNPATGMPYGAINPSTGLPYGTAEETSYMMPIVVGGLVLAGIGGYFLMRKRSTPNRRPRKSKTWKYGWAVRGTNSMLHYPTKSQAERHAARSGGVVVATARKKKRRRTEWARSQNDPTSY